MSDLWLLGSFTAGALAVLLTAFDLGEHRGALDVEAQAIERGYALHCQMTGDFAWIGECDE